MTAEPNPSPPGSLSEVSVVVASEGQASCDLEGQAVILGLTSGLYHGLNTVGSRIWQLIQEPKAVTEIRDILLAEYEVDHDTCTRDLLALLEQMQGAELVEVRDAHPG